MRRSSAASRSVMTGSASSLTRLPSSRGTKAPLDAPVERRSQALKLMLPVGSRVSDDVADLAGQMPERCHVGEDRHDGCYGEHGARPLEIEQHWEPSATPGSLAGTP